MPITIIQSGKAKTIKPNVKPQAKTALTRARLHELLDYDPKTDTFTWKVSRGRAKKGSAAIGTPDHFGHLQIRIDGRLYMRRRLVALYRTGKWPSWHDRKSSRQYKRRHGQEGTKL
jgi:hypothetical protein